MEAKNMNVKMNDLNKKNQKGNVLGGVLGAAIGTIVGAAAGTAGATVAYNHFRSDDEDIEVVDNDVVVAQDTPAEQHTTAQATATHATAHAEVHHTAPTPKPQPAPAPEPEPEPTPEPQPEPVPASNETTPDVRVLSFQTITTDDGTQMDVAEVLVEGQEALIVDADRDGWADGLIADSNADGNISDDEIISFVGTDVQIPMQELAQAAGDPMEEEVQPTYTNDGDADVIVADATLTVTPETDDQFIAAHAGEATPDYINDANVSDMTNDAYYASNEAPVDNTADDAMYASNDAPVDNADVDMGAMV